MNSNFFLSFLVMVFTLSVIVTNIRAEESTAEEKPETASQENTKPIPKIRSGKRSEVKTLEEFIPSEEVSADNPISFPTDI